MISLLDKKITKQNFIWCILPVLALYLLLGLDFTKFAGGTALQPVIFQ
jgi:hypothetical protein